MCVRPLGSCGDCTPESHPATKSKKSRAVPTTHRATRLAAQKEYDLKELWCAFVRSHQRPAASARQSNAHESSPHEMLQR
ncbi:uncharacterized protein BDR25DRAFT_90137 [Lindgomyces ingoldianus]|uniref:Uncharacterized protein n=1 Tax=Lindgomyces ingoldianus TaxID=673940 RepID=A0ACB6RA42_9PLEO|nr:uncharacterized protein BDR25DRAFT_90137 [Lindgomyces ingoldianus]KAF2476056.1 hypothetical protein BDR25DRAFT_90137 [Lindgomyces ingoldianus]